MNVFHCTNCEHLVFFENTVCVQCTHILAYLPDENLVAALDSAGDDLWHAQVPPHHHQKLYRLCQNYTLHNVCNWAVPADGTHVLCRSCRFTQVIPDLQEPTSKEAWYKLEVAKRRLLYSLIRLGCPLENRADDPQHGLAFEFLIDGQGPDSQPKLTGHANGVITINVAEADDVERERRRQQFHEPYRTVLGHFRHESGHYYWDRLIKHTERIQDFRERFGDERKDYAHALQDYHRNGPPREWQQQFVTAYASAHPWEDWAETWAHYLHMTDTLETATACGLWLRPRRSDEPALKPTSPQDLHRESFDRLIENWFALTYVLNNLNRGLGLPDGYPFVLSTPALDKFRMVHMAVGSRRD